MRRRCSTVVLCVLLGFGVSLVVPAEDVQGTAYDESEGLPYEGTPLFSIAMPPVAAAQTTQAVPTSLHLKLDAPSSFTAAVRDTDTNRSAAARVSLALLCTLLC
jgi:hypothetical protein